MEKYSLLGMMIFLSACSSGGGSSSGNKVSNSTNAIERNVAAPSVGASITATYDSDSAAYIIDGDSSNTYFWSANITNDSFTIDFGKVIALSDITVYTNDLSFSSANPRKVVEISKNGLSWSTTGQISGGDVACLNSSTGSGRIFCEFAESQSIRYLKLTITATDSPELIQIYEVSATGK